MSKSCKGLAYELVKCIAESDCVKVGLKREVRPSSSLWHISSSLGCPASLHSLHCLSACLERRQQSNRAYRGLHSHACLPPTPAI